MDASEKFECARCKKDFFELAENDENPFEQVNYACSHLIAEPAQFWNIVQPGQDEEELTPMAWCDDCVENLAKKIEQGSEFDPQKTIEIICEACRLAMADKCIQQLEEPSVDSWNQLAVSSFDELIEKQETLEQEFDLARYEHWDFNQGKLIFSNQGIAGVEADVVFVGSYSLSTKTWLWSWVSSDLPQHLTEPMMQVKDFGEEYGLPKLFLPKWSAIEDQDSGQSDAWEMAAIAASVLGAKGVYRAPTEQAHLYMLLMDVRHVSQRIIH